jgi:hypothetical protein
MTGEKDTDFSKGRRAFLDGDCNLDAQVYLDRPMILSLQDLWISQKGHPNFICLHMRDGCLCDVTVDFFSESHRRGGRL